MKIYPSVMTESNPVRTNRRTAGIIGVVLLIAIAVAVFFIVRMRHKNIPREIETTGQSRPSTPLPGDPKNAAEQYLFYYSHLDTARMTRVPQIIPMLFRILMPVIDKFGSQGAEKNNEFTKEKLEFMRNIDRMLNQEGNTTLSQYLKMLCTENAKLMDQIVALNVPYEKDRVKNLYTIAKKIDPNDLLLDQNALVKEYFSNIEQIVTELDNKIKQGAK
jgi:hypothetical protein